MTNYTYEALVNEFNEKYYNTVYTSFDLEIFEKENDVYLKITKNGNASYPIVYPVTAKKDTENNTILSLIKMIGEEIPYHYDPEDRKPLEWLCKKFNISPKTERDMLHDRDMLIDWAKDVTYFNIIGDDIEKEVKNAIAEGETTEEKIIIAAAITARRINLSSYQKPSSYEIKNIIRPTMIRLTRNGSILVNCLDYDGEEFSVVVYIKDFCHHKQDGKIMIVPKEGEYICSLCGTKFTSVDL